MMKSNAVVYKKGALDSACWDSDSERHQSHE